MSRKGGLTRIRLYGNPGTTEGRRLGGLHSLQTHRVRKTRFKMLREISFPALSVSLAELCGILAGDGHIGEYQISVTTNSLTDMQHAKYIQSLFKKLFAVRAPLTIRKIQNACVITVSSKEITRWLIGKGMVRGHKIRGGLHMPPWIQKNRRFRSAFIRGLFDTDGSVYLDTHHIREKVYKNIAMIFSNRCMPLLDDFKRTLESLDMHPTQKTKFAVFLRRKEDIRRYFEIVGSSNPKHLRKIRDYFSS